VVLLRADGALLAEYWHSGHLLNLAAVDLDGDGREEILLPGIDEGHQQAALVVLDPDNIAGASTVPPGDPHRLQGFRPSNEYAVILFPKSCIARLSSSNRAREIRVSADRITVIVGEGISELEPAYLVYEFDYHLNLLTVTISDGFDTKHRQWESDGRLHHTFDRGEADQLRASVQIIRSRK